MKTYFDFSLKGRDWWAPYLVFWVLLLALYVPQLLLVQGRWGFSATHEPGVFILVDFILALAVLVLAIIFSIVFLRIIVSKISFGGNAFGFRGSIGKFLGMNLLGFLLTIVTLSIYLPWYLRRVMAYLVSETGFKGANPEFLGKGGKLFLYYLLSAFIPIIVVTVLLVLILFHSFTNGESMGPSSRALFSLLLFIILIPFIYLVYKWYVNVRWNDVTVSWKTSFWPSCLMILGQMLLTLITVLIYWPAAFLRVYRYFAGKTVLAKNGSEFGTVGFDGAIGKGFGFIWGQTLLSIITLGIYFPWAYAKIGHWLLGATYIEKKTA